MRIKRTTAWGISGLVLLVLLYANVLHNRYSVKLELTPDRMETCQNTPVEADVTWRTRRVKSMRIFIYQIGETPKLWLSVGSKGKARTGAWMSDGTTVMLVDADGKALARKTFESVACPS